MEVVFSLPFKNAVGEYEQAVIIATCSLAFISNIPESKGPGSLLIELLEADHFLIQGKKGEMTNKGIHRQPQA